MSTNKFLILKTMNPNLNNVETYSCHALNVQPQSCKGGLILVEGEADSNGDSKIMGVFFHTNITPDVTNDTQLLFGTKYKYLVNGKNYTKLSRPVDLYHLTGNAYYQTNRGILYVQPKDEAVVLEAILNDILG